MQKDTRINYCSSLFTLSFSLLLPGHAFGHGSHGHSESAPLASKIVAKSESIDVAQPAFTYNFFGSRSQNLRTTTADPAAPKSDNTFGAGVDYSITRLLSLGASVEYLTTEKLQDATFNLVYVRPLNTDTALISALSATAPASESSKEQGKVTNLKGNLGLAISMNAKWSMDLMATAGVSTYSGKPLPSHAEHGSAHPFNASEQDGEGVDPVHFSENKPEANGAGSDHHEDSLPEKYRYGAGLGAKYQISKTFKYELGYTVNQIYRHFTKPSWLSEANVGRISYSERAVTLSLGLSLHKEHHDFRMPSLPIAKAGLSITL